MKLRCLVSVFAVSLAAAVTMAQQPSGKIHGRVTDPTGINKTVGTIGLSTDRGHTFLYTLRVSATGDYSGSGIAPGLYSVVYKMPDTAEGKFVDMIDNVEVDSGQDTLQDIDMSRKEYLDKMTPDQKRQVEEFKKRNVEIMKANFLIKALNSDLNAARAANKNREYDEAETLMFKDVVLKPDGELLWYELGIAQMGLRKWSDAIVSLKKVIDLDSVAVQPNLKLQGAAYAALSDVYARANKAAQQ
jgi:hypothetical protein